MTGPVTVSLCSYEPSAGSRVLVPCNGCGGEVTDIQGPEVYALSDAGVHSCWRVLREHEPWCPLLINEVT
jgi:hypothetical protein